MTRVDIPEFSISPDVMDWFAERGHPVPTVHGVGNSARRSAYAFSFRNLGQYFVELPDDLAIEFALRWL